MTKQELAKHRAQMPSGASRILDARSLATAHRRLAQLLKPGMSVLDVGCGTGAITRGIAEAVGPSGSVVGVDINPDLIAKAQVQHRDMENLRFRVADIYSLPFTRAFDVVTAARVLQWLSQPESAIASMIASTRQDGWLLVLDYNHNKIQWNPPPPQSMQLFYSAFLRWRAEAGMDNAIADRIALLFHESGLIDIRETPQIEATDRQRDDFLSRIQIWADVAAGRGPQMVKDGVISEAERLRAESEYRDWMQTEAVSQTLYLLAVEGRVKKAI